MVFRRALALALLMVPAIAGAQRVIPLYPGAAPGSESWTHDERAYYSDGWKTQVVANVSKPTLTAYLPAPDKATGTSVVIAPGGGFYALSINSEGVDVAKWLAARGVAAFVLRYRLVKTGNDAVAEFGAAMQNPSAFGAATSPIIPMAIADGRAAIAYVRAHAGEFGLSPERVGLMGFSAGGTVVAGVAFQHDSASRPGFLVPIYAFTGPLASSVVPIDSPPMFVAAATDDDLGLAASSVELYSKWIAAKKPAELHMYARGGHGFGMRTQNLPTDTWIERLGEWMTVQGLMKK